MKDFTLPPSPISKLPVEILSKIFEVGRAPQADMFIWGIERRLARICKAWMTVVLQTPQLWTMINCYPGHEQEIAIYLRRSGNLPLHLRFYYTGQDGHRTESVCQLLSSHFWRTGRLEVYCRQQAQTLHSLFRHLHAISAPFLHYISITCRSCRLQDQPEPVEIFSGGTPALTKIHLKNISLMRCQLQLVTVEAMYLSLDNSCREKVLSDRWLATISAAASLLHLQVEGSTVVQDWLPSDWMSGSGIPVEMSLLRTLCLTVNGDNLISPSNHGLLERIIAPRLEVIVLKDFGIDHDALPIFDAKKFPSLRTVIIWDWYVEGGHGEWHLFLDGWLPNLQNFVCGEIDEDNCSRLLSALSLYDDEDPSEHDEDDTDDEETDREGAGDGEDKHSGAEIVEELEASIYHGVNNSEYDIDKTIMGAVPLAKRAAYLPELQTLAVLPRVYSSYPIPLLDMRHLLLKRKATGRSIHTLYVSAESLVAVCAEFPPEEGLVNVEVWRPELLPNWSLMSMLWSSPGECWP